MPRRFYLRPAPRKAASATRRKPSYPVWYVPVFAALGVVIAVALFWIIPGDDTTPRRAPARSVIATTPIVAQDSTPAVAATQQAVNKVSENVEPAVADVSLNGIRVQVLNGCGVRGLARRMSPPLRGLGLDVRETKNAARDDHEFSLIIDRNGKLDEAYALADSLGIDIERVSSEAAPNLADIDLTLIVGNDYRKLNLNYQRTTGE